MLGADQGEYGAEGHKEAYCGEVDMLMGSDWSMCANYCNKDMLFQWKDYSTPTNHCTEELENKCYV